MTRPARALIDIPALRHNFQQVRNSAPGRGILAVIKADAYGHGAARVARGLDERDGFAVARIQEGEALRAIGITKPVLLLSGVSGRDELALAAKLDLDLVVHRESQIAALERASLRQPLRVWLKVDTGMHRHAPAGTPVLVNDTRVAPVGRVSMDLVTVDLRAQPAARPGDAVILWGRGLPAEEVAEHVGSIAYELVTRIAPRIARESVDDEHAQQPASAPSPGESR